MEWNKLVPPAINSIKFSANDVADYLRNVTNKPETVLHVDYDWDNHVVYDVEQGHYYWQIAIAHSDLNSFNLREILFDKNLDVENVLVLNLPTLKAVMNHITNVINNVE